MNHDFFIFGLKKSKKTKKFWKNHLKFSKKNGTIDTVCTVVTLTDLLLTL